MSKNIAHKICKIMDELGAIKKDKSDNVKYAFHGYESLNGHLKPLLSKYSLALIPSIEGIEERDYATTNSYGKVANSIRTLVKGSITIICGETGDKEVFPFFGIESDYGGKSFGQAVTEMMKRFELKLFHVTMVGEDDNDVQRDENMIPPGSEVKPQRQKPVKNVFKEEILSYGLDAEVITKIIKEMGFERAMDIPVDKRSILLNRLKFEKENSKGEE